MPDPSPKLNEYDAMVSPLSLSVEREPSNFTFSGTTPEVGAAVSEAVGAVLLGCAAWTVIATCAELVLFRPRESVTARDATYVPAALYVWLSVGPDCVTGVLPSPKSKM